MGGVNMNIEQQLQHLQTHYRVALGAAVAAKAQYFSMVGERWVTKSSLERACARWQQIESRKRAIVMRMAYVEQLAKKPDDP
jgi:hypothetical protein